MLKRLKAIRQIKEYGFTLQETLAMLILFEEGVLEPERGIRYVRRKIDRIDQKIQELVAVKGRLQDVIDKTYTGGCPIDKALNEAFA